MNLLPPFGAHAAIKYASSYDAIPGTVYIEVSHAGDKYIEGSLEADLMWMLLPYYILFTRSAPIWLLVQNLTNLAQRGFATQWNLIIQTEEDLKMVWQHIRAHSAMETNRLLSEIAGRGK